MVVHIEEYSTTVASIMVDWLVSLKKDIPELEKVYYKQDNVGCYHSGNSIISAKMVGDVVGVAVVRNVFRTLKVEREYVIAKQQRSREMLEGRLMRAMMSSTLYSLKQPLNLAKELLK